MLSKRTMRPSGAGVQGDQTTHPPASLCFSFNKTQSAAARRLMHSGGAFIYSRYRYLRSSPFVFKCLQMSSALSPSCRFTDSLPTRPPPLPATSSSSSSSTPSGLNQYAWLKVSVINTRVVFQETLSSLVLICTWIASSMDRRRASTDVCRGADGRNLSQRRGSGGQSARHDCDIWTTVTKKKECKNYNQGLTLLEVAFPFCLRHILKCPPLIPTLSLQGDFFFSLLITFVSDK